MLVRKTAFAIYRINAFRDDSDFLGFLHSFYESFCFPNANRQTFAVQCQIKFDSFYGSAPRGACQNQVIAVGIVPDEQINVGRIAACTNLPWMSSPAVSVGKSLQKCLRRIRIDLSQTFIPAVCVLVILIPGRHLATPILISCITIGAESIKVIGGHIS